MKRAIRFLEVAIKTCLLASVLVILFLTDMIPPAVAGAGAPTFVKQWGSAGSENGQFNLPHSVTVDGTGKVYVADTHNNRIQVFTSTGTYIRQWGSAGNAEGQFSTPIGVAVDGGGHVYVADAYNNRVQVFDSVGTYLRQWGTPGVGDGQFSLTWGIALDLNGNVYVGDYQNHRIQVFTGNGRYLRQWGTSGSQPGQFRYPYGIAVDGNGHVYVADSHNDRVQVFDSVGTSLRQWGTSGSAGGQFHHPDGVAVDKSGHVYVTDSEDYRVQVFDSSGAPLYQWGTQGSGEGQFYLAYGVAVDGSGRHVYVADTYNNRVQMFLHEDCGVAISVALNKYVLWPPNHKMVDITATVTVTDECCATPTFKLVSVTSNEPDNGKGDGNTVGDISGATFGEPDVAFQLRAERSGIGSGRIYTIVYTAGDCSGNVAYDTVQVRVPHDGAGEYPGEQPYETRRVNELLPNHPNPFNPTTTIPFDVAAQGRVSLQIFDTQGKLVRTLYDEVLPAGVHQAVWDGRDDVGRQVATGVYFVRFVTGDYQMTKKLVMIK